MVQKSRESGSIQNPSKKNHWSMCSMTCRYKFSPHDFPRSPGVYLMKDEKGRIIYVGKALSLRDRLYSYFRNDRSLTPKTRALVGKICSIDHLLASSEKEALLLEASLIKKHRPRYNVVLRDDKQYVLFKLDRKTDYPRLVMTRKVVRDGSTYYGPFSSAAAARATWKLIGKVFPLRKCSDRSFRNRVRPCLYYDMGQCYGPCVLDVDRDDYREVVKRVELFLSGRTSELVGNLERKMVELSNELRFEEAAKLRDQIQAVNKTVERQVAVLPEGGDVDVAALVGTATGVGLGLLFIREGRLLDEKHFFWPGLTLDEGPEVLKSFLMQFYVKGRFIPQRILAPGAEEPAVLSEALSERAAKSVRVSLPYGTNDKRLVDLAMKVAARAESEREQTVSVLLKKALGLPDEPVRIEGVDASHLGGEGMRVGQVVFVDGKRSKEDTRVYAVPEAEGSADDYAALAEWAARRVESGPPWPDLVLLDGGRGQLAAVERVLDDLGVNWNLASIAKGPSRKAGELEDRIFRPGRVNPLPLKPGSPELLFLQRIRDEVHRLVIGAQRRTRKQRVLDSQIGSIPGVGPKTARMLWDHFGSLEGLLEADLEQLRALPGIGKKRAGDIHDALENMRKARAD
ncbi:excinuclease ABC subunit UvrC [Salidesulfovibrio brasiliensis]|uniref:excinuclease ABC subunit UvrC n=1 Tax=Salidesulfovibrio brasiliensis TaxID=221711 RepID=UPI003F6EDE98